MTTTTETTETRPYDDLSADERAWWDAILARLQAVADAVAEFGVEARAWWDAILARLQAVADAVAEFGVEARDRVIAAGAHTADLEAVVSAQEAALAEVSA